jgi:hypothetical protein
VNKAINLQGTQNERTLRDYDLMKGPYSMELVT